MRNKNFFFSSQKNVMEFLAPLKPVAIRIVRNAHGNKTGEAGAVSGGAGEAGAWTGRLRQLNCGDALRVVAVLPPCGPVSVNVTVSGRSLPPVPRHGHAVCSCGSRAQPPGPGAQ